MDVNQRAEWPWIAGRNELVRLVAARQDDAESSIRELTAAFGAIAGIDPFDGRAVRPSG